jgi:long-chain fatty acid transport protein
LRRAKVGEQYSGNQGKEIVMRKIFMMLAIVGCVVTVVSPAAMATNGDNLISIGPISRSMGGVGIAAPQDAISAVFSNPAAMCFGPYCPGAEVDFAGTLFTPKVDASVNIGGTEFSADSDKKTYAIPAIGLSVPINPQWRFGLAAYGVSGLGVDYRGTSLDQPSYAPFGGAPLIAGEYTQLQIMKFAPSIAYQPTSNFSAGLAVHIDYANLDLRSGSSFNYAIGVQLGAIFKPADMVSIGATYISPQKVDHEDVVNFNGTLYNLKLQAPQQVGLGIAIEPIKDSLLIEVDGRWINWASATGYDDFDWKDQWVLGIGAQYKPIKQLALRVGYNYTNNPVREHNDFVGATPTGPTVTPVQGIPFPTYYYETFRIIGFPAIVKQHITFGIGYEISKRFAVNAGYTHAFKETITENGTTFTGQPVTLQSHLSEDSLELGFTWRF